MEIYSEEQLKRILDSTKKIVIIELIDMNIQDQNELHFEINQFIQTNLKDKFLLLKINKNFFPDLFTNVQSYPSFIVFKNKQIDKIFTNINNLDEFKILINTKI